MHKKKKISLNFFLKQTYFMKGFKVPFRQAKVLKILKPNRPSETIMNKSENKEG